MMPRWLPFAASALGAAALATVGLIGVAMRRWQLETEHLVKRLALTSEPELDRAQTVSFEALASLPPPVERYFRSVLRDGQPFIRAARIVQAGQFNMKMDGNDWRPYQATQFYHLSPPGYVWDARVRLAPILDVLVRDAYVARHATMRGALMAVVAVVNEHDRPELDEGALQRYLAEAAMFPTALLPERGVVWSPIDENHATASLTDGATTACLDFAFAATGEILGVSTARRWRAEKSGYVIGAWGGRYGRYEVRNGMRVPSEADVYWNVDGRRCSYITIRVTDASFEFEPAVSR
ncbi:MAG: hypothetical protein JWN27_1855 [Candidatus Eremiobacteraeota bacterium]|nr:hypothetical protein [Candidatus Eremiobacteraeota bacterium]